MCSSDDGTAEMNVCLSHPRTIWINPVCLTSRLWGYVMSAQWSEIFDSKDAMYMKYSLFIPKQVLDLHFTAHLGDFYILYLEKFRQNVKWFLKITIQNLGVPGARHS